MADPDFGSDFAGVTDLDANMTDVSGRTCLLEALLCRISTPLGGLWYDPSYGVDLTSYVNTSTDPRVIEQTVEGQLVADERVNDARVVVTVTEPEDRSITGGKTFEIAIDLETDDGPFEFTVLVDALTGVQLLASEDA